MQRIYLMDYENVDVKGFDGLPRLTSNDTVYFFYSETHQKITLGLHRRIVESPATFCYEKIYDKSKNALDNRLVQKLEELAGNNSKANYYIISEDSDYDPTIKELRQKGCKIDKQKSIKDTTEKEIEHIKKMICERIRDDKKRPYSITDEQIEDMAKAIFQAENKTALNSQLQNIFHSKDVRYVFSRINDLTYFKL